MKRFALLLPTCAIVLAAFAQSNSWEKVEPKGPPHKRHEHAFVKMKDRFYALGGRRIQPVDIFNPLTKRWTMGKEPPLELHHFQALSHEGKVLVAGAFTGPFPAETPLANFYYYDPEKDAWEIGPEIPEDRRRGSAGAFLREGKLYLICGLTDGHRSGWVPWFDEYDFHTKTWRKLPDAPRGRDHFQAVLLGDQVVLAGGRRSGENGSVFAPVISEVDVFDFKSNQWRTLEKPIPTPRAGTMSLAWQDQVLVIGGESKSQKAHHEVEALHLKSETWKTLPAMTPGRHATQPIWHDGAIYLQAGSITRGGTETSEMIRLPLPKN